MAVPKIAPPTIAVTVISNEVPVKLNVESKVITPVVLFMATPVDVGFVVIL